MKRINVILIFSVLFVCGMINVAAEEENMTRIYECPYSYFENNDSIMDNLEKFASKSSEFSAAVGVDVISYELKKNPTPAMKSEVIKKELENDVAFKFYKKYIGKNQEGTLKAQEAAKKAVSRANPANSSPVKNVGKLGTAMTVFSVSSNTVVSIAEGVGCKSALEVGDEEEFVKHFVESAQAAAKAASSLITAGAVTIGTTLAPATLGASLAVAIGGAVVGLAADWCIDNLTEKHLEEFGRQVFWDLYKGYPESPIPECPIEDRPKDTPKPVKMNKHGIY